MTQSDTLFELEQAERALRMARSTYDEARLERNRLIMRARKEGVRPVDIAAITELTRARIAQLRR